MNQGISIKIDKCEGNSRKIMEVLENVDVNMIDYENLKRITYPQAQLTLVITKIADQFGWKVITNARNMFRNKTLHSSDLLLITDKVNISFEYDSSTFHSSIQRVQSDSKKDMILKEQNCFQIRIREDGLPYLNTDSFQIVNKQVNSLNEKAVSDIIKLLNHLCHVEINFNFSEMTNDEILSKTCSDNDVWCYKAALYYQYTKKNHTIYIPYNYVDHGLYLGRWVQTQRVLMRKYERNEFVPESFSYFRRKILKIIGFTTDEYLSKCDEAYEIAKEYYEEHGNLDVPFHSEYKGFALGKWLYSQRQRYLHPDDPHLRALSDAEIERLNEIGMVWSYINKNKIKDIEELLYNGYDFNLNKTDSQNQKYQSLLKWVNSIRSNISKANPEHIEKLKELKISLDKDYVKRRTKFKEIKGEVKRYGYIAWNDGPLNKYKNFMKRELEKIQTDKNYPDEFLRLMKDCGINPYAKMVFRKKDNELRKLAYEKNVPAGIFYRFCDEYNPNVIKRNIWTESIFKK